MRDDRTVPGQPRSVHRRLRRYLAAVAPLGLAIVVACGSGAGTTGDAAAADGSTDGSSAVSSEAGGRGSVSGSESEQSEQEQRAAEVEAFLLEFFPLLDTSKRTVELWEIVPVVLPDGIPALSEPNFDTLSDANAWLGDAEPVIVFERNGDARAYPLQILIRHEIVNDVVGGEAVLVTYCPLCNSAIAFSRVLDGRVREFGVSGSLRRSDLIMYDRGNHTLWQQISGEAIVGTDAGKQLEFLPSTIASFAEFRATHPDGVVLNRDTGFSRDYGVNPYPFYDSDSATYFEVDEFTDNSLDAKERVLTVEIDGEAVAFPFTALTEQVVIETNVAGQVVVAFWQSGTVSALDDFFVIGGRNIGAAAAYSPFLDGQRLHFEERDGLIVDAETGSEWNVLGMAVSGSLAGEVLEPVISANHFWFAWSVFQPDTRIVTGP